MHSVVTVTCHPAISELVRVSARKAGGDSAVTGNVTVTSHIADVIPPPATVCATLGTGATTATSLVNLALMAAAVKSVVATAKTTITALLLMVLALLVHLAGMVHGVTALVHQVSMVITANRHVHDAREMSPVTQKPGNVGGVTLAGLGQDVKSLAPVEHMATLAAFCVTLVLMGAAIMSLGNVFVNQDFKEKVVTAAALYCILA